MLEPINIPAETSADFFKKSLRELVFSILLYFL